MAILPYASRRAVQPGGTRQVASYSSTMHGPARGVLQVAAVEQFGIEPAACSARNRRDRRGSAIAMSGARLAAAAAAARGVSGMPRPIDLEADQLDRLLDPGAMAVGALVLGAERFFERGQRRAVEPAGSERHAQFERLALVMQAGAAPDLDPLRCEPVRRQPRPRLGFERIDDRLQFLGRRVAQQHACGSG